MGSGALLVDAFGIPEFAPVFAFVGGFLATVAYNLLLLGEELLAGALGRQ